MFEKTRLSAAVAVAMAAMGVTTAVRAEVQLKTVTVTATRNDAAAEDVPATITTIERREIERRIPADEADLFKDEPDVTMPRDLRRFGATRINIRGIEDNRVLQMVDGVRMPDFFNGGGPTNFTLSGPLSTPIDFLKRVEILRGPASSLYGSDAIGGVVAFLTLDPSDLLAGEKTRALRYRVVYSGANAARTHALLGAWKSGPVETLLGYSRTDAEEFDNQGDVGVIAPNRTRPNPQDTRDHGILAKVAVRPDTTHRLVLTLEGREQRSNTSVYRLSTSLPKVTAMAGSDSAQRVRGSINWEYMPAGAFFDRLTTRVYRQLADTDNFNRQTRTNTSATCSASAGSGNKCAIDQDFHLSQFSTGIGTQLESGWKEGGREHLLTYGADLARVKTSSIRDALVRNETRGTTTRTLAGDSFPLRDFATGRTSTLGLFVQDEISGLAGGKLSITPGLRYDWRKLTPEVDPLAQQVLTAIGRTAVEKRASAFSPKLAAFWRAAPWYSFYGQVVRGFRAPNYEEVNGAFRNTVQGYGTSPNPGLEPETSIGTEAGVKFHAERWRGQVSVYDNRYRDFIENVALNCPADPRCISGLSRTFMFVNQARARIHGAEVRGAWNVAAGWQLDGALAYARGENRSTGQPLNSVEPARLSMGVVHDAGTWGGELRMRAARAVKRTDDSNGTWFRPPGYGVTDLAFWWQPARSVQVNFAVTNLFDKKYWLWGDIRQADAPNPAGVDFYSQPGRKLALSVRVDL